MDTLSAIVGVFSRSLPDLSDCETFACQCWTNLIIWLPPEFRICSLLRAAPSTEKGQHRHFSSRIRFAFCIQTSFVLLFVRNMLLAKIFVFFVCRRRIFGERAGWNMTFGSDAGHVKETRRVEKRTGNQFFFSFRWFANLFAINGFVDMSHNIACSSDLVSLGMMDCWGEEEGVDVAKV